MGNFQKICILICVVLITGTCSLVHAQSKKPVDVQMIIREDGKAYVTKVKNNLEYPITVRLKNDDGAIANFPLQANQSEEPNLVCTLITYISSKGGGTLWKKKERPKTAAPQEETALVDTAMQAASTLSSGESMVHSRDKGRVRQVYTRKKNGGSLDAVVADFCDFIENIPFYSVSSIDEEAKQVAGHIESLRNWKDKDAYIAEHHLNSYIKANRDTLLRYSKNVSFLIANYIGKYEENEIVELDACIDTLRTIATERIQQRKSNLNRLDDEIKHPHSAVPFSWNDIDGKMYINIGGIFLFLAIIIIVCFVMIKKKQNKKKAEKSVNVPSDTDASSAIVIRRKTTSILKKQSLEDVMGNDAYLKINCNEFCDDTAVESIYIKNTCVKDIYNMYAEDLRNPDNPKEDGCMVLGRWVFDKDKNKYDVSLEQIVLPGDDAVFSEYELNFGGKIKLKVTEKLRKLRRETNLQYDLTCWVHSHPGLGVFFSNSDCNVQTQLKHPSHPNFLTAIVIDILTPHQEMGIFTFKNDSTLNSKADLKKMYSLEDLYKWAVESDRNTFKAGDYYNTLADVKSRSNDCHGIELSNGAIIDMDMLVTEQSNGLVGKVHGFCIHQGLLSENIAVKVSKEDAVPDNELIGCFVIATHCSIPSIRKAIASYMGRIKFVLVYTTTDGRLTSIPVVSQNLCTDEHYYGEQKLEELKIWTRRKR